MFPLGFSSRSNGPFSAARTGENVYGKSAAVARTKRVTKLMMTVDLLQGTTDEIEPNGPDGAELQGVGHRRQRASRRPAERNDDAARALWMFDHVAGRCIEKPPSASTPMSLTGDAGVQRCRRPVDQCFHRAPCLPQAIRNARERQDVLRLFLRPVKGQRKCHG